MSEPRKTLSAWQVILRMVRFRLWYWLVDLVSVLVVRVGWWMAPGLVMRAFFNLVTGAIAILFLKQFALAVDWVSELIGIAADDYTLKFAVFHTLFNLVGVVLMLPLIGVLVAFLQKLLQEKIAPVNA